ncbi:regulatory protein RecX [Gardnerella sp. Marseille-Q2328]|uniref:regulatory protein RecX n=1 Tax=Gardnerella sp. Marseille-Q2328 TaxID=2759694 RepID=UPI0020241304|nr:regulatory protein RecX [Gardnerella sp. Marseille-Q2328]
MESFLRNHPAVLTEAEQNDAVLSNTAASDTVLGNDGVLREIAGDCTSSDMANTPYDNSASRCCESEENSLLTNALPSPDSWQSFGEQSFGEQSEQSPEEQSPEEQSSKDIAAAVAIAAGYEVDEHSTNYARKRRKKRYDNKTVRCGSRIVQQVSQKQSVNEDDCREAALRLLDYAPRSIADVHQRLTEKGYTDATVDSVVKRLCELRLLDDCQYAQLVIRSCVARMLGARATRLELQRKNVESSVIASSISQAQEAGVFEEAAWELGRKTVQRTRNLDATVRKRRFFAAAARKGHDLNVINEVYCTLFEEENS